MIAIGLCTIVAGCALFAAPSEPHPSRISRTPEPIVVPSEPPDEGPTPPPDTVDQPGFAAAANALAELSSYRVTVSSTGLVASTGADGQVSMTATLVQGDKPAAQFRMDGVDGFEEGRLQAIVIGDEAWLKEGSRSWRTSPGGAADFDAAYNALSPIDLATGFDGLDAALDEIGIETKNGLRATHYRADATTPTAGRGRADRRNGRPVAGRSGPLPRCGRGGRDVGCRGHRHARHAADRRLPRRRSRECRPAARLNARRSR